MKTYILSLSAALLFTVLSGCVIAPARPVAFYPAPVYVTAGCFHCWR